MPFRADSRTAARFYDEETDMNYDEGMSSINNVRAAKMENNVGTDGDENKRKRRLPDIF